MTVQSAVRLCKDIAEEVAKDEGFQSFKVSVSRGCSEGDNYLSDIIRVTVNGVKSDLETHTLNLIVKVSLKNPILRENSYIQQFFLREIFVYTTMLPTLDEYQTCLPEDERFLFPKVYKVEVEDGSEYLVLEDLSAKGLVMLDRMNSFDYEQLVVCIKNIARLHAASIVLKAKDPSTFREVCMYSTTMDHVEDSLTQLLCRNIPNVKLLIKNESYEGVIGDFLDNLIPIVKQYYNDYLEDKHGVLCHGDCWTNNLFFGYKDGKIEKMVFLDWQLMMKASPFVDISFILLIGLDSEMREKHYHEMLDLYYETLSSNVAKMGVNISDYYPNDVYREQLKKYMRVGLFMSIGCLPVTLGNKGDNDLMTMINKSDAPKSVLSETCKRRMKELFEDCVKFGII